MSNITEQDIAAIRTAWEKAVRCSLEGDWDGFLMMFTEDTVVMPTDQPSVEGKDAVRAWLESWPPIRAYSVSIVHAEGSDDFASVRGTFAETVEPEPGKLFSMKGKWLGRHRKQQDGSWLCSTLIWNLDEPMTPA